MSRNAESRFAVNPTNIDIPRSTFSRPSGLKTTFNVGELIPIYLDEVLPGDSFKIKSNKVVRLQTLLTPIFDNLFLDTYFFYCPNRLVWDHWKEFNGENTDSAWIPTVEYEAPQITSPANTGFDIGTLADYFGLPTGVPNLSVNALPFRMYATIVDSWFRDQNLQDPVLIPTDDATTVGVNTGNYITDLAKGGKPFVAAKFHDYFTSALPSPQKGPDVTLPVATLSNMPVVPLATEVPTSVWSGQTYKAKDYDGTTFSVSNNNYSIPISFGSSGQGSNMLTNAQGSGGSTPVISNLWAISPGGAEAATINQLRLAFQIQKMYEKDARGGK